MDKEIPSVEHTILNAAEKLFLEKGFYGTKTTEIANLAGVNHSMIHYYYRTKEKLFQTIFEKKVNLFANSFANIFDKKMDFLDKIKVAIELHFKFLMENPQLPLFILNEILNNKERIEFLKVVLIEKSAKTIAALEEEIQTEVEKGNICPTNLEDLIINIFSLNVFSVVRAQIIGQNLFEGNQKKKDLFLKARRENNVNVILKSLKP